MDGFRLDQPIDRRTLLKGAGALGLAGLTAPWSGALAALASTKGGTPVKHVIVDMQENRSFDHYYGFAAFAGGYGVPRGYSQPDGKGGSVSPYHFTSLSTSDIGHSWNATHGPSVSILLETPLLLLLESVRAYQGAHDDNGDPTDAIDFGGLRAA